MEVLEAVQARTSVRDFKPDPVAGEDIEKILGAAVQAPTAGNVQPWYFYVITNSELKKSLGGAALGQKFVASAPVVFVTCVEPAASARRYGDRGRYLYCLQDAAAAIENMMLAAVSLNLGTCWVGAFDEDRVARLLDMPYGRRPVALVPAGYPQKPEKSPLRRPLDEVVTYKK